MNSGKTIRAGATPRKACRRTRSRKQLWNPFWIPPHRFEPVRLSGAVGCDHQGVEADRAFVEKEALPLVDLQPIPERPDPCRPDAIWLDLVPVGGRAAQAVAVG